MTAPNSDRPAGPATPADPIMIDTARGHKETLTPRLRLRRLFHSVTGGSLFSGRPDLTVLDLDHDWEDIDQLLEAEEWPFLRSDLEAGDAQPRGASFVARVGGELAGFFTTHNFDRVGYLDMMVIAPEYRGKAIARPLYFRTIRTLLRKGNRAFVVHTTNDSAHIIGLLGFTPGQSFTLVARDPIEDSPRPDADLLTEDDLPLDALIDLDASVFGMRRPTWITSLYQQEACDWVGVGTPNRPDAIACLRQRREGAWCLDQISARFPEAAERLIAAVAESAGDRRLECFARTDGRLHSQLIDLGFAVPDFFTEIGPLTEWRRGKTGDIGTGESIECLMWL